MGDEPEGGGGGGRGGGGAEVVGGAETSAKGGDCDRCISMPLGHAGSILTGVKDRGEDRGDFGDLGEDGTSKDRTGWRRLSVLGSSFR